MVQLFCKCLNVGIHCKESQLISNTKTSDDNTYNFGIDGDITGDQFFKDSVPMTLALAGITMEHDCLCWTRVVGQWMINQCAVCQTDTHATHISTDNQNRRILVNTNLESNASRIDSLRSSANYSQVFRLILPVKYDNQSFQSSPVLTSVQTSIEAKKRSLQQRVQRFLSEEQKQMEERIRTFTEQEHSRFAATQLQIGRNEESLYHILDNIANKLKIDQNLDQNLAKQLNIVENVDKDLGLNPYLSLKSSQNNANPKPFADNKQKKSQSIRYRSQSVDYESVGGIFDIDVDDGHAFDSISYSDEEEDESFGFKNNTNDFNSYNNGRAVPNAQINAQTNGQVAYSLPIQVPKWKTFHNHNDDIDEDEVPMIPNGETIAESIKKLAKSVRNESDIFGDRPRRRTNTFGDLIKSRPL